MPSPHVIELDTLTVTYDDFAAVRGVTLQVRPGELSALLGTIGAGRTSTLEVPGGNRRATSGTVRDALRAPVDTLRDEGSTVTAVASRRQKQR